MISKFTKLILCFVGIIFGTYFIHNYNRDVFNSRLEGYAMELGKFPYKVTINKSELIVEFYSDDKRDSPKYWLVFLASHNLTIIDYELSNFSFKAYCKPEGPKLKRIITENYCPRYTEELPTTLEDFVDNGEDIKKFYYISFVKLN